MKNNPKAEYIKYCRTCLVEIDENSDFTLLKCTEQDTKSRIQQKILDVLPEINLNVTPDAIVCHDCAIVIESTYQFKKKCLEIEVVICKSLQESPSIVNFMTIVHKYENNFNKNPIKLEFEVDDKYETEELNSILSKQEVETTEQHEQKEKKIKTDQSSSFTNNNEEEVTDDFEKLSQLEIIDSANVEFNTDLLNFIDGSEDDERSNDEFKGEKSEDEASVKSGNTKEICEAVGPFICFLCGYSTILKSDLIKHVQNHVKTTEVKIKDTKKSELLKCSHCDYATYARIKFEKHSVATHGDYRPYKCTQCKYDARVKSCLRAHMFTHSSKKPFKCDECNFTTANKNYLIRHEKKHKTWGQFKCTFCTYSSYSKNYLEIHMTQHTGGKQFKCDQCEYLGACKLYLDRHKKIHTKVKSFKCNVCDYACVTGRMLKLHVLGHTGEKPYKCKLCEFSTTQATHLKIHVRRHTGDKPYKCTTCGYRTVSKTQLSRHKNMHLEDKPYKCSECDYSTTQPSHLKIHIRKHTGEKPYKCTSCDYSAYSRITLNIHIKTHTGERPYKCKFCNYASIQSSPLKMHMKQHHKETK